MVSRRRRRQPAHRGRDPLHGARARTVRVRQRRVLPDRRHGLLFTTEAHTAFTYVGGEVFTFRGDDDLWVFVNGKLAVDLGGLHQQQEETIDFDANRTRLGIEVGQTYPMDIFHAERHTSESNFRIQTTIDLSCIENLSVD